MKKLLTCENTQNSSIFMVRWLLVLPFLFLTCSQNSAKKQNKTFHKTDFKQIKLLLETWEKEEGFKSGKIAFALYDIKDEKPLIMHQAEKTLHVASCLKVLTTSASLDILGTNYRFETHLEYSGKIEKGILKGNVYLKGFGDPTTASPLIHNAAKIEQVFRVWTGELKARGIKRIEGKIILDDSTYPTDIVPAEWIWGDMGNYYGSPACAFNVFDNTYQLHLKPANKIGDKPTILGTTPILKNIEFVNELVTAEAGSGDQATINGHIYDKIRYVNGSIPLGNTFTIKGAMPDPATYLAEEWHNYMKKNGILVTENPTTARKENIDINQKRIFLKKFYSEFSVKEIIKYVNYYSSNLYAEALLKRIGAKQLKKAGTNAGTKAVMDYWKSKGIDTKGMFLKDGSGMARSNGITAQQLTEILVKITKEDYYKDFYISLPLANKEGTMLDIGKEIKGVHRLRAKTGGMSRVYALTGYFRNKDKQMMAFTLIFNDFTTDYKDLKRRIETFLKVMVENS